VIRGCLRSDLFVCSCVIIVVQVGPGMTSLYTYFVLFFFSNFRHDTIAERDRVGHHPTPVIVIAVATCFDQVRSDDTIEVHSMSFTSTAMACFVFQGKWPRRCRCKRSPNAVQQLLEPASLNPSFQDNEAPTPTPELPIAVPTVHSLRRHHHPHGHIQYRGSQRAFPDAQHIQSHGIY